MLTAAALLPALGLLVYIYRKDKIEKEPIGLVLWVVFLGAFSTIPAMFLEVVAEEIFNIAYEPGTVIFILVNTFIGVALVEEYCKYLAVCIGVWRSKAFNYRFDAIVYAVSSAIGFAALENLLYVADSGLGTALLRAFTAVPGHVVNGITMGLYLGPAKAWELYGDKKQAKKYKRMAILIPAIEHGIYDSALELDNELMFWLWLAFVLIIDLWAFRAVQRAASEDDML